MSCWKKCGKALLWPPALIRVLLLALAAAALARVFWLAPTKGPAAWLAYALSAYTLAVWCAAVPGMIAWAKRLRRQNPWVRRWLQDTRLRMNVSLLVSFFWAAGYSVLQLCLGVYHASFWYCAMAVYHLVLALMRLVLVCYTRRHVPGEDLAAERRLYRACGWLFLVVNLAVAVMIFFMVCWNRTFRHHPITTIALAAYAFAALTMAVVSLIRGRKADSPVQAAVKRLRLAVACVSMLTLEATMLTTFGGATMDLTARRIMLAASGAAVSAIIIGMAVGMLRPCPTEIRT